MGDKELTFENAKEVFDRRLREWRGGSIKRFSRYVWKHLFCRVFHNKHRCFPEVWGRGLKGPWHCDKCHPCNEIWDIYFPYGDPECSLDEKESSNVERS